MWVVFEYEKLVTISGGVSMLWMTRRRGQFLGGCLWLSVRLKAGTVEV